MSSNRYYYNDLIDDDRLCNLALKAKNVLWCNDSVVKIYRKNNELLYGETARQMLFLMKQNNTPLFSSNQSPGSGTKLTSSELRKEPSTPVTRNPDAQNLPRRNLLLDSSEKKACPSGTSDISTPVIHQKVKTGEETAKVDDAEERICPSGTSDFRTPIIHQKMKTFDEIAKVDGNFACLISSPSSPETSKEDSPRSAEITMMTTSMSIDDKKMGNSGESVSKCLPVNKTISADDCISTIEKQASYILPEIKDFNSSNQGSPPSASCLLLDENQRNFATEDRGALHVETKAENSHFSEPINKNSSNLGGGIFKIPELPKFVNKIPSPVNRVKKSSTCEYFQARKLNLIRQNRLKTDLEMSDEESTDSGEENSFNSAIEIFKVSEPTGYAIEAPSTANKEKNIPLRENRVDEESINTEVSVEKSDITDSNNKSIVSSPEQTVNIPKLSTDESNTPSPVKIPKISSTDLNNKPIISSPGETVNIPKLSTDESNTPSPVKIPKICNTSPTDIQEFSRVVEGERMAESSHKNIEGSITTNLKVSPIKKCQETEDNERVRKRKSPNPQKRNVNLFTTIPRVIRSDRLEIEVPFDLDNISPSTSRDSSPNYGTSGSPRVSPKENPVTSEPKFNDHLILNSLFNSPETDNCNNLSPLTSSSCKNHRKVIVENTPSDVTSVLTTEAGPSCKPDFPNTARRFLSPARKGNSNNSSPEASSSGTNNNKVIVENKSFGVAPISADGQPIKAELNFPELIHKLLKFNTVFSIRYRVLDKIHNSLLYFRSNIEYLMWYVKCIEYITQEITLVDKLNFTKELKEAANNTIVIASKLKRKFLSWEKDSEDDLNTWRKGYQQIIQLKNKYEPLMSKDGNLLIHFEDLQAYENNLRAIWKGMDDIIIITDSRRALFLETAYDLEKLMKRFAKFLIMVNILLPLQTE